MFFDCIYSIRYRHRRADFVFGSTADDLRDSPFERKAISARFEEELNDYHKGFRRIGGDRMSRVRQVAVRLQARQPK